MSSSVAKPTPRAKPVPSLPRTTSTSSVPFSSTSTAQNAIRFQFLLADENLGAISKSSDQCSSSSAFFDEALAAFNIVGKELVYSPMAGVKVLIDSSAGRPIFVPWRDKEGYDEMMQTVMDEARGRTNKLNIEVTCVPKSK